jgi:hypothetical protein
MRPEVCTTKTEESNSNVPVTLLVLKEGIPQSSASDARRRSILMAIFAVITANALCTGRQAAVRVAVTR